MSRLMNSVLFCSSMLPLLANALPFSITPMAGAAVPHLSFPNSTQSAYYTVRNNTQRVLANNYVKYLPPGVMQNLAETNVSNLCGARFTLQPNGMAGDSCQLALTIAGPVDAADPNPHRHLFVCTAGGATCAGTPAPLEVQLANSRFLFQQYFYNYPIADSLLGINFSNPFFGPFGVQPSVKRCDQPSDLYLDASNPAVDVNTISCRWGDYNSGPNAGRTNMQIRVDTTTDIRSVRASCTFIPQSTSRITFVMGAKSAGLPIADTRPGETGLIAHPELIPVAATVPGVLPVQNPSITTGAGGIQQIEVTFPNYNSFVKQTGSGPITAPASELNMIFIINNNSGAFELNDTLICTVTPQFTG